MAIMMQPWRYRRAVRDIGQLTVLPHIYITLVMCLVGLSDGAEVCVGDSFHANCGPDEVVLMTSARYGRMQLGSCITIDYGNLGCYKESLAAMDRLCSGKQVCEVPVDWSNADITADSPCGKELSSYLDVEYNCVKVAPPAGTCKSSAENKLRARYGLLSSHVTADTGCGGLDTPWVIEASPGQRINVSLVDFGWTTRDSGELPHASQCDVYGYISERRLGMNNTLCGGLARERHVYYSASNSVQIQIPSSNGLTGNFILQYEVAGCPDVTAPDNAWYKRNGSTAVIGCEWSEHSWHLKCERNTWVGVVGNCSSGAMAEAPKDDEMFVLSPLLTMGLIVGLGVLVITLICVLIIGYICCRRKTPKPTKHQTNTPFDASLEGQAFLYYPGRPVPIQGQHTLEGQHNPHGLHTLQAQRTIGYGGMPTQHGPKPSAADELLHIWETPLPEPVTSQQDDSGIVSEPTYASLPSRGTMAGPCQPQRTMPRMATNDGVNAGDVTWPGTRAFYDQGNEPLNDTQ